MASMNTLRANIWDAIYTYLQTTNPISTNNIFSAKNSKLVNSVGYPMVIINPPRTSISKLSANGYILQSEVTVSIEIFHTSSANLKTLSDNVTAKLLAGRTTFTENRLMNMMLDEDDYGYWEESNKTIHMNSFSVSFRYVEAGF